MGKGEATKQAILDHAMKIASAIGFDGISIGGLAHDLNLSKSGLFAHFRSKETLQLQVLDMAGTRFSEFVVQPAMKESRGIPRIRKLFNNWLHWIKVECTRGGCVFVAAASELDDKPGPVRDRLVSLQMSWHNSLADLARDAIAENHFKNRIDPLQFSQDIYGIMLSLHYHTRLLRDLVAEDRAIYAFETMLKNYSA